MLASLAVRAMGTDAAQVKEVPDSEALDHLLHPER
jgi:hypothetical protein